MVANIETLRGWAVPGGQRGAAPQEALAYEMAAHWGCRYVQVIGDADGPLDRAAARASRRCAIAPPTTACSSGSSGCRA